MPTRSSGEHLQQPRIFSRGDVIGRIRFDGIATNQILRLIWILRRLAKRVKRKSLTPKYDCNRLNIAGLGGCVRISKVVEKPWKTVSHEGCFPSKMETPLG